MRHLHFPSERRGQEDRRLRTIRCWGSRGGGGTQAGSGNGRQRPVRESSNHFPAVAASFDAKSSSQYASGPASLVPWLAKNLGLTGRAKWIDPQLTLLALAHEAPLQKSTHRQEIPVVQRSFKHPVPVGGGVIWEMRAQPAREVGRWKHPRTPAGSFPATCYDMVLCCHQLWHRPHSHRVDSVC